VPPYAGLFVSTVVDGGASKYPLRYNKVSLMSIVPSTCRSTRTATYGCVRIFGSRHYLRCATSNVAICRCRGGMPTFGAHQRAKVHRYRARRIIEARVSVHKLGRITGADEGVWHRVWFVKPYGVARRRHLAQMLSST
jgi:hypothetical protein